MFIPEKLYALSNNTPKIIGHVGKNTGLEQETQNLCSFVTKTLTEIIPVLKICLKAYWIPNKYTLL